MSNKFKARKMFFRLLALGGEQMAPDQEQELRNFVRSFLVQVDLMGVGSEGGLSPKLKREYINLCKELGVESDFTLRGADKAMYTLLEGGS